MTTDPSGRVVADEMTDALDEYIGPVALLVNDTREDAVIIIPGRRRLPRKSLDSAKGGVLSYR